MTERSVRFRLVDLQRKLFPVVGCDPTELNLGAEVQALDVHRAKILCQQKLGFRAVDLVQIARANHELPCTDLT